MHKNVSYQAENRNYNNFNYTMKSLPICLSLLCLIVIISCNKKSSITTEIPACIEAKIEEFKQQPVQNPPVEIWKWETKGGENYYYITSPCCDQYNYIHDENCNEICAPDGGITGDGDGNCPDFEENVVQTLVWKDNRQPDNNISKQEQEQNKLSQQMKTIVELAESVECTNANEWKLTAYGSKPCGGPWGYIAYHNSIDEDHFLQLVEQHQLAESKFNTKYGIMSDCMVAMKPNSIKCEEGKVLYNATY